MVGPIERLIAGFRAFHARYYEQRPERMQELAARGQSPDVMLIACSDARVDPALLLGSEPGELFMVRNIANLIPPYGPDHGLHGTSASIEYAVRDLGVRHIIVLGHSACGGIEALRAAMSGKPDAREFMAAWTNIAADACTFDVDGVIPSQQQLELEAIRISLRNLETFPWVVERIEAGVLDARGWWVDLDDGRLCEVSKDSETLRDIVAGTEVRHVAH
jgi:carbonic anhydrase